MLEEDVKEQAQKKMLTSQNTRKMQAIGTNDGAMKELIKNSNQRQVSTLSSNVGSAIHTPPEMNMH